VNFKLTRKYLAISLAVAVTFLWVLATPAAAGETQSTGGTSKGESQTKAEDIIGGNILAINQFIETTYRFKQGTLHVKKGDTVVLSNATDDVHTFSLVDASLLPKTIGDVFGCGAPGGPPTICGPILFAHLPNGFPNGPPTAPPTPCGTTNPPGCVNLYIDGGQPSPTPPGLDTAFTLKVGGDSVAIGPGAPPIKMTVTAEPGTTLAFMCAIHAWMQGKMVVDGNGGENN
jgi:plastocyanin